MSLQHSAVDGATRTDPPPVVLAHGWGGSYDQTWRGSGLESDLTAAGRIVLTVDLPGHGRRPCSHRPADYSDIAEQLWACLPQAEQLDAVGYSLGGKLLLRLAAEHPGSFRRLVILGVGQNAFVPEDGELLATALLQGIPDHAPESLRTLLEEVRCSGNDLESLAAVIQRPPDTLNPSTLGHIDADVLLVVGERDDIAGPTDNLASELAYHRLLLVPGLDHAATPTARTVHHAATTFLNR